MLPKRRRMLCMRTRDAFADYVEKLYAQNYLHHRLSKNEWLQMVVLRGLQAIERQPILREEAEEARDAGHL